MKKAVSVILAVLFVFMSVPIGGGVGSVVANAADYSGTWGSNMAWSLSGSSGVLEISGSGEMLQSQTDYPWMQYENQIETITISGGVTSIADHSFEGCSELINVIIASSVLSIGDYAFAQCPSLTDVALREGLKSVGEKAFYSCTHYTEIKIPGSVDLIGSKAFGYVYLAPGAYVSPIFKSLGDDEYSRYDLVIHCYKPSVAYNYAVENELSYLQLFDYLLEVSHSTAEIVVGETFQLSASIAPSITGHDDIYWDSENENIATVSEDGLVTALSEGTVGVCAIHSASGVSKYCEFTITYEPVTGVSLNHSSYSLNVGETVELIPTILPSNASDKSVIWTSDNNGIASVNDGVVTAVSSGTAQITARTVCGDFTASCSITVSQPVTGVYLDCEDCTLEIDDTLQLNATVMPTTATNKGVVWHSSDNSVASVVDGLVTASAEGTAIITVETVDGGYVAVCNITVDVEPEIYIAVNEEAVGPLLKHKVKWWRLYKNDKLPLETLTEGFDIEDVETVWISDNEKVVVDENGVVNNTGIWARSANITVNALDENEDIIASDEVRVIIYRFGIELLWVK